MHTLRNPAFNLPACLPLMILPLYLQVKVVKADGADDGKAVVAPSATKKAKS